MINRAASAALALLILASCGPREGRVESHQGVPVILISIDTLRADRLPMFGYDKIATPHLDTFRRDAILFRNAYAHVPLTLPSHASMLTGLLPPAHKVRNNIGYLLPPDVATLPALMKARGYATGAAISAYVLRGATGISRGFDFYDDGITNRGGVAIGTLARPGRTTSTIALDWIRQRARPPFFFMLHLFEPHAPYEPSYDGEIVTVDAIVGDFLGQLKQLGVYDQALIIVVSDHGEGLNDHGEPEHGIFLYREAIHVPLLVKLPRSARKGETVDAPVGLVDLAPTIAEVAGVELPRTDGHSLLGAANADRRIYSESFYPRIHLGWSELRSLIGSQFHFIQAPKPELYDVRRDTGERTNVLAEERRVYAAMRGELEKYGTEVEMPATIDPEDAKKLAALGYLASTPQAASGPLPDPKDRIGEIAAMIAANQHLQAGRFGDAMAALRAIVGQNPQLSDAWVQLGAALESAGRDREALDVYRRAIDVAPELAAELALKRGSLLLKLERYEEAEQHARLAEKTSSGSMHLLLARIALAKSESRKAEQEATAAAKDPGSRLAAELLLAQAYTQQGRLSDALALVERVERQAAAEQSGPIESLSFVRGDILGRMERYDEAAAAFRKEIESFPRTRQTYANLYLVYMVTNRPADAERVLEELVRAIPSKETMLFAAKTASVLGDEAVAARWRRRAR